MGPPLRKGVILLLGLVWCRSKCRRVIVRSLAASPNAEIGICACCSYKVPAPFCFDRRGWAKHSFGPWLAAAARRLHRNVLATAFANKLARIALTVLVEGRSYAARVEPRAA